MDVSFVGSSICIHTPAKLNLFLEVLGKRSDGFHEIETLMVPVRLYDTLYIERDAGRNIRLDCHWATGAVATNVSDEVAGRSYAALGLPDTEDNLAWKAVQRLRQHAEVDAGLNVRLIKRIPAAAGMGGASSDAAAALVGANLAWQLGWTRSQLREVAAELGSDVPFFLQDPSQGPSMALCRGRGERIEPLAAMPRLHFVIVQPPEGLSTADVYRRCRPAEQPESVDRLVAALRGGCLRTIGRTFCNRLQDTAEQLSAWVNRSRRVFDEIDCLGHQMSGSGTSYFALCRHARHARRVLSVVRAAGFARAYYAETTNMPHDLRVLPA